MRTVTAVRRLPGNGQPGGRTVPRANNKKTNRRGTTPARSATARARREGGQPAPPRDGGQAPPVSGGQAPPVSGGQAPQAGGPQAGGSQAGGGQAPRAGGGQSPRASGGRHAPAA